MFSFKPKIKIFTDVKAGNAVISKGPLIISKADTPGYLRFSRAFKKDVEYQVTNIEWEEAHTRSIGKAAAGAIVGGVLTGGIGLLAGAALGGRRKEDSTAILVLQDSEGKESKIHIKLKGADLENLQRLLSEA